MSVSGVSPSQSPSPYETESFAPPARSQSKDSLTSFPADAPPPSVFERIGDLFEAKPTNDAEHFDLGALLASIFDFAGKLAPKEAPKTNEVKAGGEVRVQAQGSTGDAHLGASGRAAAEAHARALASSTSYRDGATVGARAKVEASVGASAEAKGEAHTDWGSISGRARVEAEAYARAQAEAQAGPTGLGATASAQVGAKARAEAESNLNIADGWVAGHADAHAEAGAGAQTISHAAVSYAPPQAIIESKGEAFAGARAGYSAKGGIVGIGYGIRAEVWAGAGVKAEATAGLAGDGKFKLALTFGISLGVGGMVRYEFEFDTKAFGKAAGDVLNFAAEIVGGILGAVAGVFDGGTGKGAHAGRVITQALQSLTPLLSQAATKETGKQLAESAPAPVEHRTENVSTETTTLTAEGHL